MLQNKYAKHVTEMFKLRCIEVAILVKSYYSFDRACLVLLLSVSLIDLQSDVDRNGKIYHCFIFEKIHVLHP